MTPCPDFIAKDVVAAADIILKSAGCLRLSRLIPPAGAPPVSPGSPCTSIAGKPLIQHVWGSGLAAASALEAVFIATDDMRIAEAAFDFGANVSLTSPKHLSGTDRIAEVAKKLPAAITHVIQCAGGRACGRSRPDQPPGKNAAGRPENPDDHRRKSFRHRRGCAEPECRESGTRPGIGRPLFFAQRDPVCEGQTIPRSVLSTSGHIWVFSKFLRNIFDGSRRFWKKTEQLEQLRALENGAKIRVLITKKASIGVDTPEDAELVTSQF